MPIFFSSACIPFHIISENKVLVLSVTLVDLDYLTFCLLAPFDRPRSDNIIMVCFRRTRLCSEEDLYQMG